MKYLMCQVGLSFFFLESDGSYTVKPYNFYILPSAAASTDDTSNFVCQVILTCNIISNADISKCVDVRIFALFTLECNAFNSYLISDHRSLVCC